MALLPPGCNRRPDDVAVVVSVVGAPVSDVADPNRAPMSRPAQVLLGATARGLVAFDAAGGVQPALAARWIVTGDGRSFIFRLDPDARWPDGAPVTAEQVASSLRRAIGSSSRNPLRPYLSAIDEIVAMTPSVVEVRLSRPRPDLLKLFAQPELAVERRGRGGSGPFRIADERAEPGAIRLSPIAPEDTSAPPQPEDHVVLRGERAALAIARFAARKSDLVDGGRIAHLPLVGVAGIAPVNVKTDLAAGLFGLAVTRRAGFLATPLNRAAVALAIDRTALTNAFGLSWPAVELILPDQLDSAMPPAAPDWAAIPADQRLLAARARVGAWGRPVALTVALPDGPGGNLLWSLIGRDLRSIGVRPQRVEEGRDADLALVDAVAPYDSGRWYLRRACQPCSGAVARAIAAARDAPDLPARAVRIAEADRALAADVAFIPIARPLRWSLVAQRLRAWTPNVRAWHPLNHLRRTPD